MKKELQQYAFSKEAVARNYDPRGIIVHFYNTAFHKPIAFSHKSLGNVQKYQNVQDGEEIARINALLSKKKAPLQEVPREHIWALASAM